MDNASVPTKLDGLLTVSPSPHIKHPDTTRTIMITVLVALLPALVWSVVVFGWRSLTVTAISVCCCVFFEFLYQFLMKKPITVLDFSAAVTGVIIAFNLPVAVPLWALPLAAFFAIVVVKQLFGGIGKNIVNPALAARVFLLASWPDYIGRQFVKAGTNIDPFKISFVTDSVSSATPLSDLNKGDIPDISLFDMFVGNIPGCIGEVSALFLTVGGLILLVKKVITWHIPVTYIATVYLLSLAFPLGGADPFEFAIYQILSGGVFLGAIFMATDYATSPVTSVGRIIFGVGCGLLTVFIRYFGGYPEGVSFAILIMNLLVWYIDRFTKPVKFGGGKNVGKQ